MLEIGTRLGPYEIVSFLGAGGMGSVYRARDSRLARDVAIKVLSPQLADDADAVTRFEREAKAVAALSHPNIVAIYDFGRSENVTFAVTELLEGETLRESLRGSRMTWRRACEIAVAIADALEATHERGIVHRDLKPENVFLGRDGRVKVLDFGLARTAPMFDVRGEEAITLRHERRSSSGAIVGTVGYMAPEQLRGEEAGPSSDLFSFGCVLYEMIAGSRAFDQSAMIDVLVAILKEHPPRLSARETSVPPQLDQLVAQCLGKTPATRLSSARAVATALRSLLASSPSVSTTPSSPIPRQDWVSSASIPRLSDPVTFTPPVTQYARSGNVNIAYQVLGTGPLDLVFVMGWITHLEYFWLEPSFARFLRRLASFSRLILIDKRGTGLSDRIALHELPTLEQRMDDVRAVMQAVGSERAALCGVSEGGPMCSLFAATYPDRTTALVMIGTYAKRIRDDDYPWAPTAEQRQAFFELMEREWGGPVGIAERAPSKANDPEFREWWSRYLRMGASPGAAVALTRMNAEIDVRNVLPTIRVPSLVIHRTGDLCLKVEEGRYVASRIPEAKFVELPGNDHLPFVGDQDAIVDEIEEFLTGVRHTDEPDRVLATILHARVVEGLRMSSHRSIVEREIDWYHGRLIRFDESFVEAAFDGPARAVRCAEAIRRAMERASVRVAAGLHTGECDLLEGTIVGMPFEIATAISAHAASDEVLVTSTVRDLVAGSGLEFREIETAAVLRGEWRVYRVTAFGRPSAPLPVG